MRKRIGAPPPTTAHTDEDWLDLERAATVEVTSEDQDFPIESSFIDRTKARLARVSTGSPDNKAGF